MERSALAEKNEEWIKMDDRKDGAGKKQSRFQVAKVDFAVEKHSDGESSNEEDGGDQDPEGQPLDGQSWNACTYDTHNVRSLRHYTREALPRLDHYRNVMSVHGHMERPTLDELHNATLSLLPDQKFADHMRARGEEKPASAFFHLSLLRERPEGVREEEGIALKTRKKRKARYETCSDAPRAKRQKTAHIAPTSSH
ncbi:hypothetical protein HPB48_006698 [Haemaphysalis longicornis]|uniref:Amino acid permease N-terminal domain-containing protein n=1 Tax=Haemaphysalis longicornis TaxID=44386 RepID=A0A9J6G776_HAELO|nr:hypothetical protein HPB48_006698 [Haemaphysalis longicornis]